MKRTVEAKVRTRIVKHGPGWCFAHIHFHDLGSDASIRKALSMLEKQQFIQRVSQGIYYYPKIHKQLGTVPPNINTVAEAIAKKNNTKIQPSGSYALNLIGLSEQVPGQIIFLTEGPARRVKVGNHVIIFKRTSRRIMYAAGTREGTLIQALKNLGREHIDQKARNIIKKYLESSSIKEIKKNMKYAPSWIRTLVFEIMEIDHE